MSRKNDFLNTRK